MNIISHSMHGVAVAQRTEDGYVNATKLAKAYEAATGKRKDARDWLKTDRAKEYMEYLRSTGKIVDLSKPLVATVTTGKNDLRGTYLHPKLAIPFGTWLSIEFEFQVSEWIEGWAKDVYQRSAHQSPILESPKPWTLTFEQTFETELSRLSGLHKNDIRNGRLYWEFIYSWMTTEDKDRHDAVNPVLAATGRRKYKIHQMLDDETKNRLTEHVQSVMNYMLIANSASELRRMVQRRYGIDQPSLFDGWMLQGSKQD